MKFNKKAFTIIELIVVMSIIGVLVLFAVPKFIGHTKAARFTRLIANTKQLETASERYYIDKNDWPRLGNNPYTADQLKSFTQKIYDSTGKEASLDPSGNYYDIDYNKLSQYISIADDKQYYIIQNPVGNIYALDGLSKEAEARLIDVPATEIKLNFTDISLNIGTFQALTATIKPDSATNKNLIWSSSDTTVAVVDNNGKVTAIKSGIVIITASTENGKFTTSCNVTINTSVTGVVLDKSTAAIDTDSMIQLIATILPTTATNKSLIWTSSNASIATVDSSGLVTGISVGNTTITAKTQDGNYISICNLTVNLPFTTVIFTNASATGAIGPTQTQLNTAYVGTLLESKVTSNNGIQIWTVPLTGNYRIETYGASGATGSIYNHQGTIMKGDFTLTKGTVLRLLVGQQGLTYYGGGGGTFVTKVDNASTYKMVDGIGITPLIISGGGGYSQTASPYTQASAIYTHLGGKDGNGGETEAYYQNAYYYGSRGGGGLLTDGQSGGGKSFLNGGQGLGEGGFGGGTGREWGYGSNGSVQEKGAGGGYSGGAGGSTANYADSGSGGASYNSGTNQVATSDKLQLDGKIIITYLR